MKKTTNVVLEEALVDVGLRNAARAAEVIKSMGTKYACHPANLVRKDSVSNRFQPTPYKVPAAPLVLLHRRGAK